MTVPMGKETASIHEAVCAISCEKGYSIAIQVEEHAILLMSDYRVTVAQWIWGLRYKWEASRLRCLCRPVYGGPGLHEMTAETLVVVHDLLRVDDPAPLDVQGHYVLSQVYRSLGKQPESLAALKSFQELKHAEELIEDKMRENRGDPFPVSIPLTTRSKHAATS